MRYLIFLSIFLSSLAYATPDQLVLDAGLGVFNSKGSSLSQNKFAKIGYQEDIWYNLKQRFNIGAWLDTRGPGYSNSAFGGYQLGFEVENSIFDSSIFAGPSLITTPDQQLGGILQFNESIYFGIKDDNYDTIGIALNHFSSAGLEMPNQGENFLCVEIKMPFEF